MLSNNYIIILLLLGIFIWIYCNNDNKQELFVNEKEVNQSKKRYNLDRLFNTIHKSKKRKSKKRKSKKNNNINNEFIEIQYHKDYYDTLTAINGITSQKELFNMGFLPVKETIPNNDNIDSIVDIFITKLNNEINNNVTEYLHTNSGWDDMGKRRRIKSGFEEIMEDTLGLPGSIHNEPTSKANVKLIKIDKAEQYTSNDQIRFITHIIVQKENTKDQMVLKVLFFMERDNPENDGNKFFEKDLNALSEEPKAVIIEQVFTVGYLTNNTNKKTNSDNFHNYKNITRKDGTIDQERVIKSMLQKHSKRSKELNSFMCSVDNETQQLHNVPNLDNYENIKNTRTILDDLSKYPHNSFGDINI